MIDVTENRNSFLGGSEVASIIGLNKYKSKYDLWLEKTGKVEREEIDNEAIRLGNRLEPVLFELFKNTHLTEYDTIIDNTRYFHKNYNFLVGHIDGLLVRKSDNKKGVLEIKTTTIQNKNMLENWKDKIPDNYFCQILHYMNVCNLDFAVVYAYLNIYPNSEYHKQEIKEYYFSRNDVQSDIEYLEKACVEFWNENVLKDVSPEIVSKKLEF